VVNRADGSLSRIAPQTNSVIRAISVGESPVAVAVGEGAVWVANAGDRSVAKIAPRKNEVVKTIPVEHRPQSVAVASEGIWVTLRP